MTDSGRPQELTAEWCNPPSPLNWVLGPVNEGFSVKVEGYATETCDRFKINLQRGSDEDADVLFHFNPRFGQNVVVRNARFGGLWGPEEREGVVPFERKVPFVVEISVSEFYYFAQVDGKTLCLFSHRRPFSLSDTFAVSGDLVLSKVSFKRSFGPSLSELMTGLTLETPKAEILAEPPPYTELDPSKMPARISKSGLPLSTPLPFGFALGNSVVVSLTSKLVAIRFKVELRVGPPGVSPEMVLLHFNPRFEEDGGVVVFNTKINGVWGKEERHSFDDGLRASGSGVQLRFLCESREVLVFVNGAFFAAYRHRIPPGPSIDTLHIDGDAEVENVGFY